MAFRWSEFSLLLIAAALCGCVTLLVLSPNTLEAPLLHTLELAQIAGGAVFDEKGSLVPIVLPELPKSSIVAYNIEPNAPLLQQVRVTAAAFSKDCGGTNFNDVSCSEYWTEAVTVYDMRPPHGVVRGRVAWLQRMHETLKKEPHDRMTMSVESVGWVGDGTEYVWANGYWFKFLNGKQIKQGRYSSILVQQNGKWAYHIFSTIQMHDDSDWIPVQDGYGGPVRAAAQSIANEFASGYNKRNYKKAFEGYSLDAKFPFMRSMGGTSLAFAISALDSQKKKLTPIHLDVRIDEALVLNQAQTVGVAHGFSKSTDADSKIYTFGRFSLLLILERADEASPWKVKYDFSPNNWLLGPDTH